MDKWKMKEVRRRISVRENIIDSLDQKALKWFGYVEVYAESVKLKDCTSL